MFCIKKHFSDHSSHALVPMMFEPEISIRRLFKCCETLGCTVNKSMVRASSATTTPTLNEIASVSDGSSIGSTTGGGTNNNRRQSSSSTIAYKCDYCAFSSTWKYDLKIHLKQKHNVHRK